MTEVGRSDSEIVAAALEDPDEFRGLFRRHYESVYRFAARRIGTNEAEDIAAETFLTAYRILHRFDQTRTSALPWLLGIASNTIGDAIRQRRRRDRIYMAVAADPPTTFEDDDVAVRVDSARAAAVIHNCLRRLSKRDRETFLLYALADLSYPETGEALNVPTGTVASRMSRVRRQFREATSDIQQILKWMDPSDGGRSA